MLCQTEKPKSFGDAVSCAERHVGDEPFVVLLGDSLIKSSGNFLKINSAVMELLMISNQ